MKISSIKKSKNKKPTEGYIKGSGFYPIDSALEETRGMMPFQENLMQLFANVCDIPFGGADNIRRIVGKKYDLSNPKEALVINQAKEQWIKGCDNHKIPRKTADEWWNKIMAGAGYGFNIAHAVAYSVLTYKTLWYRKNFPAQFIASRLNSKAEELDFWLVKAVSSNVEIVPPKVNVSTDKYIAKDGKLYMSLNAVDRLGDVACQAIINKRPFTTLKEFRDKLSSREVNSTLAHSLYMIGALDDLTGDYEDLDTGRTINESCGIVTVTEPKGKKREWTYKSKLDLYVDFLGGTILFNGLLAKKIQELTQDGYKLGLIKKITDGFTKTGKEKKEIYFTDSKFPDLYIGGWQMGEVHSALGKNLSEHLFVAYKTNSEYGNFLLVKNGIAHIEDLTEWVG